MRVLLHSSSLAARLLGGLPCSQLPALASQAGFQGIEWLDRLLPSYDPRVWQELARAQAEAGLGAAVLSLSLELGASPLRVAEQVDRAKGLLGQAAKLGARVARVAIGGGGSSLSRLLLLAESLRSPAQRDKVPLGMLGRALYARALARTELLHARPHSLPPRAEPLRLQDAAWALQPLARMAQDMGLRLGLENHFGLTSHAQDMLTILELVSPAPLGVCLDLNNFAQGLDPLAEVELLAPHAVHVHYKAHLPQAPEEAAKLAYPARLACLKRCGYTGDFAVEYLGGGDGLAGAKAAAEALRGLWRARGEGQ